ncbi:helix-turn-helix domain-containing protein [Nocardioides sp.]|uniref:helix-turn-helix transcriptional regulator n=1 Tax=Nocardioides sp. TaxID=35761 RepID=UPI0039E2FED8
MKSRGHLNPSAGAPVMRLPPPARAAGLVGWFWVPEWDLPEGVTHRALVLTYAACNLVVDPEGMFVYGPSTRISERVLSGRGWAVGALLRPAATPLLVPEVRSVLDSRLAVDDAALAATVTVAMAGRAAERHAIVSEAVSDWLLARRDSRWPAGPPGEAAVANRLLDLVDGPEPPHRLGDLADALGVSPRAVQRIARRYVGITPAAMLRRRRLQDAVPRVQAGEDLAAVAAELGYADQAHLTRDFRTVLGFTPARFAESAEVRGSEPPSRQ